MAMKVEMNLLDPEKFTQVVELTIEEAVYRTMVNAVISAKQNLYSENSYTDRTNNLRSSIGFVIYKDGVMINSYFEKSGVGTEGDGMSGIEIGLIEAEEAAKNGSPNGFVCVLVAGMDYAGYVESKGYDVISGSWLHFNEMFKKEFEVLHEQVSFKLVKI